MKHKKYESIEGIWKTDTLEYFRGQGVFEDVDMWCATEKVHGSNFSFYFNRKEMKCASRNRFVEHPEEFYRSDLVVDKYSNKIIQLANIISCDEIIVYGELCGGHYPHNDIENDRRIKGVQKEVYYHPEIEFIVFDIMIDGEFFMPLQTRATCNLLGIPFVPIVETGTFEECVEHDNAFQTKIPDIFGLPPIENNISEGIVIRPYYKEVVAGTTRVVLKSKNEKFYERQKTKKKPSKPKMLPKYVQKAIDLLSEYVTENRLRNVLSKIGPFSEKDFKKIFDAFKEDIYKDFNSEYDLLNGLTQDELRQIDRYLGKIAGNLWRPIYLKERQ